MKKYKILALTDHLGHSNQNSIYAILNQMSDHSRCQHIDIASRGQINNFDFFYKNTASETELYVTSINNTFEFDPKGLQFDVENRKTSIYNYDIIFLRLPRPISDQFLIELSNKALGKIIINDPIGIITSSNKSFLLSIAQHCPPIALCNNIDEILSFTKMYDCVLKPLKSYGGKGLVRIINNVLNDGEKDWPLCEYLEKIELEIKSDGFLAMKYLENVHQGDKRLIVVDGEIMASSLRLPPKGSWLCNVARGGTSVPASPEIREIEMIRDINPKLKDLGIFIYGLDTLVGDNGERVISEINTLSIGGFPQAEIQTKKPIIKLTLDKIFKYADTRY